MKKGKILLIFGAPGSGKGTISNFLQDKYHYYHFSCGDRLRNINKDYQNFNLIMEKLKKGELLSDEIINQFFDDQLKNILLKFQNIIIEGYPRTINQAEYFQNWLQKNNLNLKYIFDLIVDNEIIYQRIINRIICPKCGAVYNLKFLKPKINNVCDRCSYSPLLKRNDDNSNTIKTRIFEYKAKTEPIIDFFKNNNYSIILKVNENHFLDLNKYFDKVKNI